METIQNQTEQMTVEELTQLFYDEVKSANERITKAREDYKERFGFTPTGDIMALPTFSSDTPIDSIKRVIAVAGNNTVSGMYFIGENARQFNQLTEMRKKLEQSETEIESLLNNQPDIETQLQRAMNIAETIKLISKMNRDKSELFSQIESLADVIIEDTDFALSQL